MKTRERTRENERENERERARTRENERERSDGFQKTELCHHGARLPW